MRALYLVGISVFLTTMSLFSFPDRDARGERVENFVALQSRIKVSLSQRNFQEGERITLHYSIQNVGKEVVRIFPAGDFRYSFQIIIKDEDDRLVPPLEDPEFHDPVLKRRTTVVNLVGDENKEISLHRNESFSKTIYLDEYYSFQPNKKYFITGYFYPNYTEDKSSFLRSENTASFLLQKSKKERNFTPIAQSLGETGVITPEETIFLFLGSEMRKNWESHFKWLDFSEYILAYDRFSSVYIDSHVSDRDAVVEEFKQYLTSSPSGILKYFKVLSVDYPSRNDARVQVYVERMQGRFKTRYEYSYSLKKDEGMRVGYWQIKNLLVKVKK